MPKLIVESQEPSAASIGGVPRSNPSSVWPTCRLCESAMQFLAQFPLSEHDNPAISARNEMFLVFQCQAEPGMCDDWDAESGGNCAILTPTNDISELEVPRGETLLPARTNVRFVTYDDTLQEKFADDAYYSAFDSHELVVLGKVGGRPSWLQGDETPSCACGSRMTFFAQVEERGGGGINFGDSGTGYAFLCASCNKSAKFLWQCC